MSEKIKLKFAKYEEGDEGRILKDGYIMSTSYVVKELNRKSFLESKMLEQNYEKINKSAKLQESNFFIAGSIWDQFVNEKEWDNQSFGFWCLKKLNEKKV